jgi:hypothetical protein
MTFGIFSWGKETIEALLYTFKSAALQHKLA